MFAEQKFNEQAQSIEGEIAFMYTHTATPDWSSSIYKFKVSLKNATDTWGKYFELSSQLCLNVQLVTTLFVHQQYWAHIKS